MFSFLKKTEKAGQVCIFLSSRIFEIIVDGGCMNLEALFSLTTDTSHLSVWTWTLVFSMFGLLLTRVSPWLAALTLPIATAKAFLLLFDYYDPDVGAGLLREHGEIYMIMAYGAIFTACFFHLSGALLHWSPVLKKMSFDDFIRQNDLSKQLISKE